MQLLSIIIPTLNESEHIRATLKAIEQCGSPRIVKEVIVVDSGSVDGTQDLVLECGVKLLQMNVAGKGRALALNYGARYAKGDVLLFLDADSIPPLHYDAHIDDCLRSGKYMGGAFDFVLDGKQFGLRVVEWVNRLRYNAFGNYYGDQGIFVQTRAFQNVGGYPESGILEASHFCDRLKKIGKLKLVRKPMITSSRRFVAGGIYRVLRHDFKIWLVDFLGGSVDHFALPYWQDNVKRGDRSLSV